MRGPTPSAILEAQSTSADQTLKTVFDFLVRCVFKGDLNVIRFLAGTFPARGGRAEARADGQGGGC